MNIFSSRLLCLKTPKNRIKRTVIHLETTAAFIPLQKLCFILREYTCLSMQFHPLPKERPEKSGCGYI